VDGSGASIIRDSSLGKERFSLSPALSLPPSLPPTLQSYKRTTGSADITDWLLLTLLT